jgi:putative transposase
VERLIGTIRREYLNQTLFWNSLDLARKLDEFKAHYNRSRVHQSLDGVTPTERTGKPRPGRAALDVYTWQQHCRGLFQTPLAA